MVTLVKHNAEPALINAYIQAVKRQVSTAVYSENPIEQWPKIKANAVELGKMFALVTFDSTYSLSDEERLAIVNRWSAEANALEIDVNLYHLLVITGMDQSDPELQRAASSVVEIMVILEENNETGMTQEYIRQRFEDSQSQFRMIIDLFFSKTPDKPIHDWFTEYWKERTLRLQHFLDNPLNPYIMFFQAPSSTNIEQAAHSLYIRRQLFAFEHNPDYVIDNFEFPSGGHFVVIGRKPLLGNGSIQKEAFKPSLREFLSTQADLTLNDDEIIDEDAAGFLMEIMISVIEDDELLDSIEFHRRQAAGGMSTISERGDAVTFKPTKESGDRYLESLGIQGLRFYQLEDSIGVVIKWFNLDIPLIVDSSYELEEIKNMSPGAHAWLENLVLSYIGGIKQNLFDTDKSGQPNSQMLAESEQEKQFRGRRPHLRVLRLGQKTSVVDLENPELSDEEETKFVMTHFGVSLFTLNKLFESVQDSILALKADNFNVLLQLYEEMLPDEMKMRTNPETVKSILIECIKRTVKRKNYRVRYQRRGLHISESKQFEDLHQSKERFEVTLVHEAKPKTPIEVEPMTFWCPEVSREIEALDK